MHADVIRGLPANGTNNANAIADRYFQLTSPLLQVWLFWLGFCMMYFHPACPLGSEKTLQALFCSLAIITNMPWNYQPDQFSSLFSWPTNQRTRGLLWSTAWALISKPYFDCRINIFWVSLFVRMIYSFYLLFVAQIIFIVGQYPIFLTAASCHEVHQTMPVAN